MHPQTRPSPGTVSAFCYLPHLVLIIVLIFATVLVVAGYGPSTITASVLGIGVVAIEIARRLAMIEIASVKAIVTSPGLAR
jgi:uncharacterized membrane protein